MRGRGGTNYAEMTSLLELVRAKHERGEVEQLRAKYAHGNFSVIKKVRAKISQLAQLF